MKRTTYLSLFLLSISAAIRADDSITMLYDFTEDMRTVVLKAPGGNPFEKKQFNLTATQADQVRALSSLDNMTREFVENDKEKDCNDKSTAAEKSELADKINKRDLNLSLTVITNDSKFEQEVIGRFMANEYNNYLGRLAVNGNVKANDIYSIAALESKYNLTHPGVDLSKLSLTEKEKALNEFANNYLGTNLPSGLLMKELVFDKMVNNSSSWKESLAMAKDTLTNEQKIELVSKVGGYFGNKYNYDRFNLGNKAEGFVTIEQLFDSLKNGNSGGVCRDIALAQTQMLKELGFKNNYVVTYKTISGYHSDVISTDPTTGKIVKFNYAEATEMKKGSGTEALIQDSSMPDHGINFRIHDSDGKSVTQVPSELGQILRDTAGGSARTFTDVNYSIAKVGVKFGGVDGNLFTGKTSSGESIYGVAVFKKYNNEFVTIDGGISLSKIEGDRTVMNIDQENLYARIGAELRTPRLEFGNASVAGFVGAEGEGLIYKASQKSLASNYSKTTNGFEIDGKADFKVGVRSDLHLGSDTILTNKTYMTMYPDMAHVASADKVTVVKDSLIVESGISHKISEQQAIIIDTVVMMKNYGTSVGVKAAYEDSENKLRIKGGYTTPMNSNVPTFLPGGNKHAYVGVDKETKSGFVFSVEYDRNLDKGSNTLFLKASKRF